MATVWIAAQCTAMPVREAVSKIDESMTKYDDDDSTQERLD